MFLLAEDEMPDDFVRKLNEIGDGTPRDIQAPTDDTTFERQSREKVKLYRLVNIIMCYSMLIIMST